jgi:DNA polymerase-3 subunit alpha
MSFFHAHQHSRFSLRDGLTTIVDAVAHAKSLNIQSVCITDHGSISSWVELARECFQHKLKPIFGTEAYLNNSRKQLFQVLDIINTCSATPTNTKACEKCKYNNGSCMMYDREVMDQIKAERTRLRKNAAHLPMLAKNRVGFYNIIKIMNDAQSNYFYYSPLTALDYIKDHSQGIIALSGCVSGEVPKAIMSDYQSGLNMIKKYIEIFGDDFYLEIMPINMEGQKELNQLLIRAAHDLKVPMVMTKDCHYINRDAFESHNLLLSMRSNPKSKKSAESEDNEDDDSKDEANEGGFKFGATDLFMCSEAELLDDLKCHYDYISSDVIEQCLYNINEIDNKIELFNLDRAIKIPKHNDATDILSMQLAESMRNLGLINNPVYVDRLKHELNVIKHLDLVDYVYIVYDYMRYAHEQDIMTGGRGSACGSLVLYLLGVHDIDPIKYGLLFERFLNVDRVDKRLCLEI